MDGGRDGWMDGGMDEEREVVIKGVIKGSKMEGGRNYTFQTGVPDVLFN